MSRLIGVPGGTSWPSTMLAYRKLNEHAGRMLGGHHSARVLLCSTDYHPIKSHHQGGCEAVVTACTELPLVITQDICAMPVIDPLELQTPACANFAMG